MIKVQDIAWLELEKPDLLRAEAFAQAFGFSTSQRSNDELHPRGTDPGSPCLIVRRGSRSRFLGVAFTAQDRADVVRLVAATGVAARPLPDSLGGLSVDLVDPSGIPVRVVADTHPTTALPRQTPQVLNVGRNFLRSNPTRRPLRRPARVQRLGHVVLQTTRYTEALDWYLDHLGMIVSDFLYFPGQRDLGPTMSFIRCDRLSPYCSSRTTASVGSSTSTCSR